MVEPTAGALKEVIQAVPVAVAEHPTSEWEAIPWQIASLSRAVVAAEAAKAGSHSGRAATALRTV
jgi:hypothetical protein